jgi:D-serine deaminase-like pyridoxal phosphate-dependent protein
MHVNEIETPAIVVDLDILEHNLRRVADYAKQHGLRLRPHTKTHKSAWLGGLQLEYGAAGLTVAKAGEAEVMLRATPRDLLVAYPVMGETKLQRLMDVARQTELTVAIDSAEVAQGLSDAASRAGVMVGVLVEADVGLGRVGVPDAARLVALAKQVDEMPGLVLKGFNFYPGHVKALDAEGLAKFRALNGVLAETIELWRQAGLALEIVSGGSTPTLFHSHELKGLNEIRPGTYVFNDRNTIECGAVGVADCAAHIHVTVVSTNRGAFFCRGLEDLFVGPAGDRRGGDLRTGARSAGGAVHKDERRARIPRSGRRPRAVPGGRPPADSAEPYLCGGEPARADLWGARRAG